MNEASDYLKFFQVFGESNNTRVIRNLLRFLEITSFNDGINNEIEGGTNLPIFGNKTRSTNISKNATR